MAEVLRLLVRGTGQPTDYGAMSQRIRRFHGYRHDPTLGPQYRDTDEFGRENGMTKNHGAFVKQLGEVVVISMTDPHISSYLRDVRAGSYWPADEATAQLCGVPFDPDGIDDDHGEAIRAAQQKALGEAKTQAAIPPPPKPTSPPKGP